MLQGNTMPEENKALTLDDIKGVLNELREGLKTELMEETNRAVTGAFTKFKKAQDSSLGELVEQRLTSVLDGVISGGEEPAAPQPTPGQPPQNGQQHQGSNEDPMAKFNQILEARLAEQQQQIQQQAQQQIEAMQQQLQKERLASKQQQAKSELLQKLNGKVTSPKAFLATLETDGVATFDPDKGYGVKSKDEFGNETFTSLDEYAPTLLQSPDYSWAVPARPGQGLGTEPSTQATTPKGQSVYAPEASTDPVSRFEMLKKQQGGDIFEKLAEL